MKATTHIPKTKNRQSTSIRQEQIKQAALEIIYSDGLNNLSTRNIAKHIGISEGTIFRHFPTKYSIIVSIIDDVESNMIAKLKKIALSDDRPDLKLKTFLHAAFEYLNENRGITMLMFSEALHTNNEKLKTVLSHIFNLQKSLFSKIIFDGVAEGLWDESVPIENVAALYIGILLTFNVEIILHGGEFYIDDYCNKMIRSLNAILKKQTIQK